MEGEADKEKVRGWIIDNQDKFLTSIKMLTVMAKYSMANRNRSGRSLFPKKYNGILSSSKIKIDTDNPDLISHMELTYKLIEALFCEYELKTGDWEGLALSLAFAHVPAFRVVSKRGRPSEWTVGKYLQLVVDVEGYLSRHAGKSEREACFNLVNNPVYKVNLKKGASLYTKYKEAKALFRGDPMKDILISKLGITPLKSG